MGNIGLLFVGVVLLVNGLVTLDVVPPRSAHAQEARFVTPPLERGLLPGVLRDRLIATGEAEEGDLVAADLAGGFFIGNALRGLIPAILA